MIEPAAPAADPAAPVTAPAADPAAPATPPAADPASPQFSPDLPEGWHLQLGDEFASHTPTLERFKNVGDLARSYVHARQMKPAFPGPDAAEQDVATWRELAGVPETPDGYQIEKPEDYPEELDWSDDRIKAMTELAHKHHVHPTFLKEAIALETQLQSDAVKQAKEAIAAQQEQAKSQLIDEWGAKFDENTSLVRHLTGRLAEQTGLEPEQAQALANQPAFAKVILKVNSMLSEDSTRGGNGLSDVRGPQQRANDIMAGKDPEWGEAYAKGDRKAMELVSNLLQEAEK